MEALARNRLPNYAAKGLLAGRLLNLPLSHRTPPVLNDNGHGALIDFLCYEQRTRFVGEYMTKVDGATMHYGLETRSPFLDQDLWEYASSVPIGTRLHVGRLKAILRKLARRRIGWNVAWRRKAGFRILVQRWIIGRWSPLVETVFRDSLLDKEGWICSKSAVAQLESAVRTGMGTEEIWHLFVLESWLRYETVKSIPIQKKL